MDVPAELRLESREKAMHPAGIRRKGSLTLLPRQSEGARVVHTRYGAWYLPINLWRRRRLDEVKFTELSAPDSLTLNSPFTVYSPC